MQDAPRRFFISLLVSLSPCLLVSASAEERSPSSEFIRIGIVSSLVKDVPDTLIDAMSAPFSALMTAQTGTNGKLCKAGDACTLGKELTEDRVKLGIFHGIEFAWARQKYPQLRPLVVAINGDIHLRAVLVVRTDNKAGRVADLQGQTLAMPKTSRDHCAMFLDRRCEECGQSADRLFGKLTMPSSAEDALDDVVDGVVQAAVIDSSSLDCFKRRKPGRCAKLKVVLESEVFPAAVVAYDPASLSDAQAQRFRSSMLAAHKSVVGRQLMTLWKITTFEPVPDDYDQTLLNIAKAYPLSATK
jgi:ABC-type phosphate/phosphonate transport system substrate-binding protein